MLVGFVSGLTAYLAMTNSTSEYELEKKMTVMRMAVHVSENECHVVVYILLIDILSVTNVISAI
jgi:hypothetical protein